MILLSHRSSGHGVTEEAYRAREERNEPTISIRDT